jgi:hypothetical protein
MDGVRLELHMNYTNELENEANIDTAVEVARRRAAMEAGGMTGLSSVACKKRRMSTARNAQMQPARGISTHETAEPPSRGNISWHRPFSGKRIASMGLSDRVDRLEKGENENSAPQGPDPGTMAILDELARLKSSQAVHHRGGQRLKPENLPQKTLGEDYTRAELRELAMRRALQKQGHSSAEIAELMPRYLAKFEHFDRLIADNVGTLRRSRVGDGGEGIR